MMYKTWTGMRAPRFFQQEKLYFYQFYFRNLKETSKDLSSPWDGWVLFCVLFHFQRKQGSQFLNEGSF